MWGGRVRPKLFPGHLFVCRRPVLAGAGVGGGEAKCPAPWGAGGPYDDKMLPQRDPVFTWSFDLETQEWDTFSCALGELWFRLVGYISQMFLSQPSESLFSDNDALPPVPTRQETSAATTGHTRG